MDYALRFKTGDEWHWIAGFTNEQEAYDFLEANTTSRVWEIYRQLPGGNYVKKYS